MSLAFAFGLHFFAEETAKIGCTSAKHASKLDAFAFGLHYLCPENINDYG